MQIRRPGNEASLRPTGVYGSANAKLKHARPARLSRTGTCRRNDTRDLRHRRQQRRKHDAAPSALPPEHRPCEEDDDRQAEQREEQQTRVATVRKLQILDAAGSATGRRACRTADKRPANGIRSDLAARRPRRPSGGNSPSATYAGPADARASEASASAASRSRGSTTASCPVLDTAKRGQRTLKPFEGLPLR